jgi:hypothetical protein
MDILCLDPDVPDVPEEDILEQANGDISAALRLAASFGYKSACFDIDKAQATLTAIRREPK